MKEELRQKEINYVRGKTAGSDVIDHGGNKIVSKGDTINDDVISRAERADLLHALMLSAAAAVIGVGGEEAARRLQEFHDITENHEADLVLNSIAAWDVTDLRGNVIASAGQKITNDMIDRARDEGLLQDLVLAAAAPGALDTYTAGERERPGREMGYNPYPSGGQNPT